MDEKLVTVKIREKYRDMAKNQSEVSGIRMYRLIEQAIEKICIETSRMPSQHVRK